MEEIQPCGRESCPGREVVDCRWGTWRDWSGCTKPCAGGYRERVRVIEREPEYGGKACERAHATETEACNTQACPEEVHFCSWQDWGSWEECSASCGGGQMTRLRKMGPDAKAVKGLAMAGGFGAVGQGP